MSQLNTEDHLKEIVWHFQKFAICNFIAKFVLFLTTLRTTNLFQTSDLRNLFALIHLWNVLAIKDLQKTAVLYQVIDFLARFDDF